jgi:hypothetical protein
MHLEALRDLGRRFLRTAIAALALWCVLLLMTQQAARHALGSALLVVAALAPLSESGYLARNDAHGHQLRAFGGSGYDPQREPDPRSRLTPLGAFLFVSIPLAALGMLLL